MTDDHIVRTSTVVEITNILKTLTRFRKLQLLYYVQRQIKITNYNTLTLC